jgi:hypothetical protein
MVATIVASAASGGGFFMIVPSYPMGLSDAADCLLGQLFQRVAGLGAEALNLEQPLSSSRTKNSLYGRYCVPCRPVSHGVDRECQRLQAATTILP